MYTHTAYSQYKLSPSDFLIVQRMTVEICVINRKSSMFLHRRPRLVCSINVHRAACQAEEMGILFKQLHFANSTDLAPSAFRITQRQPHVSRDEDVMKSKSLPNVSHMLDAFAIRSTLPFHTVSPISALHSLFLMSLLRRNRSPQIPIETPIEQLPDPFAQAQ